MIKKDEFFLLKGLKDIEKEELLSLFPEPQEFKKGDIIYSAEKFSNAIGFIKSGKAEAIGSGDKSLLMKTFDEGTSFGAAAVFNNDEKYVSTIKAKTDMEIIFLSEKFLIEIFKRFPKTATNYISFLSDKIRFLNKKLSLLSCSNTEDTVFNYILSIADKDNISNLPKSMTALSKMLGISRASLYRSLEDLENKGYISRQENKVKVINYEKNS